MAEQQELVRQSAEQEQHVESLRAERQRLEAQKAVFEQEWNQARARTSEVDDSLRFGRQRLSDLREARSGHETTPSASISAPPV